MTPLCFANPSPPSGWIGDFHPQAIEHAGHTTKPLRGSARREPLTFSSCIPPFAAVTLTLEDGAFSAAWRRAMATGFLSLFYLTFLPVVFFPRQPIDTKEPQNDSSGKEHAYDRTD